MKKAVVIIGAVSVVAVVILVLWGFGVFPGGKFECEDPIECVHLEPGEPLLLAVLQPLDGRLKNSGTTQIRGIQIALDRKDFQIAGHPIELQLENSQCSEEGGALAALKVTANPKIIGIIGTNCSGAAAEASKIMSEAGLVMISGTNSAASLTSTDGVANEHWYPGYFRTMYNSISRGEASANFAYKELNLTKAVTIHDGDPRSIELVENFEQNFKALGGNVVLSTAIDRQDSDMKPVLTRAANAGAEVIFYPFFPPETVYVTQQAAEIPGLENTALMVCGSTSRTDEFIKEVGEAGIGLYTVDKKDLDNEIFLDLKKEYDTRYSDLNDTIMYAFAFDAANILYDALEQVIVEEKDGTLHIGRQALRDAMYATKDHDGATGVLTSDAFGDCGTPRFNILQIKDPEKGYLGLMENEVYDYTQKK